jgi:hypothetical protein
MSGYSVDWTHKSKTTTIQKEPVTPRYTNADSKIEYVVAKKISAQSIPVGKLTTVPVEQKTVPLFHAKKTTSNYTVSNFSLTLKAASNAPKTDKGQPQFYTGDEQEDDHARKSLIYGVLSLASPAAGFLIMLGIVLSVGGTLAKPAAYAAGIFALGCAGGLIFAIFAIINGFIAISEINAAPGTYDGKGDAVLGILLAALVPIGLAAYLVLRFH